MIWGLFEGSCVKQVTVPLCNEEETADIRIKDVLVTMAKTKQYIVQYHLVKTITAYDSCHNSH